MTDAIGVVMTGSSRTRVFPSYNRTRTSSFSASTGSIEGAEGETGCLQLK